MMKKNKRKKNTPQPPMNLSCPFNGDPKKVSYKDVYNLKKNFITTRGRLLPASRTGVSPRCQRKLSGEIKRARYLALLPYVNYL
jgi:small subunit ribosomal protein S18